MEDSKLNIIVIDDNLKKTDPLLVQLQLNFKDANVILKDNAKEGLEYILDNLNNKMIVLLDYDLGAGEPNGTEIFLRIREQTALLYVIIITAKLIDNIPNGELVTYINKDALAVIDKTISLEDKIILIKKAIHALDVKVDCILEQWIANHSEDEQNEPYLTTTSGDEFTLKKILNEIRQQTDFGRKMERNIMMLTVDLLTRRKKQVGND
jgi:DNA-binding NtrC family response regulator